MGTRARRHQGGLVPVLGLAALFLSALVLAACVDHDLVHPRTRPPGVREASQSVVRGKLLVRLEWAWPEALSPPSSRSLRRPTVLVHPEAGHEAREMGGVLRDLAAHGYVAVAADYRRALGGRYRNTLFTWREPGDARVVYDLVAADPRVDPTRIGLLGFSQGGVYSLDIAAETSASSAPPAAVVAYYPVTDFAHWLDAGGNRPRERWVFRLIRHHFYRQSGAHTEDEFAAMLAHASPLLQADRIHAPVLLIHGDADRSANVEESRRLAARLRELGRTVELVVIPGAGHVFNFRNREQAARAWAATVDWLDRYVGGSVPCADRAVAP